MAPRSGRQAVRFRCADRFLIRDAERLRYRDEGRGLPLVLVHGWALDLEMWNPQATALAGRYRIVRMDRRGFGLSSGTPDLKADPRDLAALLAHLRLGRIALLGMSQGARVALSFAAMAAERIACLILDGAPADARLGLVEQAQEEIPLARYRELLARRGIEAVRCAIAAHPLMRPRATDARIRRLADLMLSRYAGADLNGPLDAPGGDPVPLERLGIPVLVLSGALDSRQRQRTADAVYAALPRAERARVPRAGHLANLDNPQAYNAIIAAFLERHAWAPRGPKEPP